MNNNEKFIIDALRSFIDDKGILIPKGLNWETLEYLSKINSISAIVWYVLKKSDNNEVPGSIKRSLFLDYNGLLSLSINRDERMKELLDVLNNNGIDHLLFKGYVIKDLYTVPELRVFGDIDFAVRLEDRKKSDIIMCDLGYRLVDDWEPVYSYMNDVEHYEIHTELIDSNINDKFDYKTYFLDFWQHAVHVDRCSFQLTSEYHLIFLLMHIIKHLYGSGAGIRMYLDIAFYIRRYRDEINWIHFSQEIERLRIEKFVNTAFSAIEKWFGIDSPIALKETDDAFLDQFITFTLNGGVFGDRDKPGSLSLLRKSADEKGVRRVKTFMSRTFPSAKTIEVRYTYLKNKHWLLPVAWIHRLIKNKRSAADYLKSSKEIFLTDKDDVMRLQKIYDYLDI